MSNSEQDGMYRPYEWVYRQKCALLEVPEKTTLQADVDLTDVPDDLSRALNEMLQVYPDTLEKKGTVIFSQDIAQLEMTKKSTAKGESKPHHVIFNLPRKKYKIYEYSDKVLSKKRIDEQPDTGTDTPEEMLFGLTYLIIDSEAKVKEL